MMKKYNIYILFFLFLSGCTPSLKNLKYYKLDIIGYYESGKYDEEVREKINNAISDLKGTRFVDSSAVVFDIDETALSNYEYIKSADFGYNPELWNKWINEKHAPAITSVKDFYNFIIDKKIHVIFLTGRTADQYQSTYDNLISAGYTKFDTLIVRPDHSKDESVSNYKNIERMVLSGMGYKIIACLGDQDSDFSGQYTGLIIKLPNYLYIIE